MPGRLKSPVVPVAALLAALLLLTSLPYLLQAYGVGLVTETLILGLWAVSLNVLAGQTGLMSMGHAATLGTSAYVLALLQRQLGWSFFQAAPAAIAAAVAISVLFALSASRSSGVYFILVTLAQGMLVWGVIQRWSTVTGGDDGMRGIERPEAFSDYYSYYWFALWVVGGSLIGVSKRTIVEFSFMLAVPTMLAATGLELVKGRAALVGNYGILAVGFVVSFLTAIVAIKSFLGYIKKHDFAAFGWYRVALAVEVLPRRLGRLGRLAGHDPRPHVDRHVVVGARDAELQDLRAEVVDVAVDPRLRIQAHVELVAALRGRRRRPHAQRVEVVGDGCCVAVRREVVDVVVHATTVPAAAPAPAVEETTVAEA